jgi:hypothetical protein
VWKIIVAVELSLATLTASAGTAQADGSGDYMYLVGSEIQPGTYRYTTVPGTNGGSWELCRDTACDVGVGLIDMATIDGGGHTGYLTVPSTARYLKINNLTLTPMR